MGAYLLNELPRVKSETWRYALDRAREEMAAYCVPTIGDNIRRLGGLSEDRIVPRDIKTDPSAPSQPGLFDDQSR